MQATTLIYDGTFDGFLSAVFYVFEYKLKTASIQPEYSVQNKLFSKNETILTNLEKSQRVWKGLKHKLSSQSQLKLYYAFLSEQDCIEGVLLNYIQYVFSTKENIETDYSNSTVLKISQIAKMVGREKHRMEAFVRFRLTKDGIYFATIEPDFNVLPLISKHFKNRYADQKWVIYDTKRKYGIYFDLNTVEIVDFEFPKQFDFCKSGSEYFDKKEFEFQTLWKDYFKSTTIASRKNIKLHTRHVPKRYWKYLSEKYT